MKFLIPTDFSKLSIVAVHYALELSKKLDAQIVLLKVVNLSAVPRTQLFVKAEERMVDDAKQDSIQLINKIKTEHKGKLNIGYKVICGYPVEDVVTNFAHHNNFDLIIIGTKGASDLTKVLIGSNATAVINKSDIPVIIVPEFGRFNSIKNIVYATNMWDLDTEIKTLIPLAIIFNSNIHILHVISPSSNKKIDPELMLASIKKKYSKITFHVSINDNIAVGIDEYVADIKADMLAMFTHEVTFFEKLFGKSVTREMAFHTSIPLLTFNNNLVNTTPVNYST